MSFWKQPEPEIGGPWGALSLRGARVANGSSMHTTKSGLRAPSPPSKQDRIKQNSSSSSSSSSQSPSPSPTLDFDTKSSPLSNTMRSYFQAMSSEQLTQREEEASRTVASPYTQRERNVNYNNNGAAVTPSLNMTYASQQYYTPISPSFVDQQQQQQQNLVTQKESSPQKYSMSTAQRGKTSYARPTPTKSSSQGLHSTVPGSPSSPLPSQQQRLPWVHGPLGPYCVVHSQSVLSGPCSECLNPTQKPPPMPVPLPEPINTRSKPLSPLEASALLVGVAGLSLNHVLMRLSRKANEVGRISRAGLVSVLDHAQRVYAQTHSFDKRLSCINPAAASVLIARLWRILSIISNAEDASAFKHSGVGESEEDTIDYQIVLTAFSPLLSGSRDDKLRVIFSNASEDHHVNSTARLLKSSPRLNRRQVARLLTHIFAGLKVFETVDEELYMGGQARTVNEVKLARDATSQAVSITDKVLTAIENKELSEEPESTPQLTSDLAKGLGVKPKSSSCSHRELDDWFSLKGLPILDLEPNESAEPARSLKKPQRRSNNGDNNEEEEEVDNDEENNEDNNNDEKEEQEEDSASLVGSQKLSSKRLPKRSPFVIRPLVAPLATFSSSSSSSSSLSSFPTPLPPFTPITSNPTLIPSSSFSSSSFSSSSTSHQYTINDPSTSNMNSAAAAAAAVRGDQQYTQTPSQDTHLSSSSSSKYRSILQALPNQHDEQTFSISEDFKFRLRRSAEVIFGPPLSIFAQSKSGQENPSLHKLEILAESLLEHRRFAIPCSGVSGGESPRAGFVTIEGAKRALFAVWKKRHVGAAGSRRTAEDAAKTLSNAIFHIVAKNQNRRTDASPLLSSLRIDSILSAFAPLLRLPGQAVTREEINLLSSFSSAVSSSLCQQADAKSNERYFLKPLLTTHLSVDVGDREAASTDVDHLAHTFVGILS